MRKPRNHVTEALLLAAGQKPQLPPLPEVDEELLAFLEAMFPPVCYTGQDLEGHLMYAGKVELIAMLRAGLEEQSREINGEDLEDAD